MGFRVLVGDPISEGSCLGPDNSSHGERDVPRARCRMIHRSFLAQQTQTKQTELDKTLQELDQHKQALDHFYKWMKDMWKNHRKELADRKDELVKIVQESGAWPDFDQI